MRKLLSLLLLLGLMGWVAWPNKAAACTPLKIPAIREYSEVKGNFIFVRVFPELYKDAIWQEDPTLRDKYRYSGLYLNDGSTTPIWTIQNNYVGDYQPLSNVDIITLSSDGKHMVSYGRNDRWGSFGVTFWENGQAIKNISATALGVGTSDEWCREGRPWFISAKLDEASSRFRLETVNNDTFVFDLQGNAVEVSVKFQVFEIIKTPWFVGPLLLILSLLTLFLVHKHRQKNKELRQFVKEIMAKNGKVKR